MSTGCAPVLVAGMFHKSSKTKHERQEFLTKLQETNLKRESAGLKPLDNCTEMAKFDEKWANKSKFCQTDK